MECPTNVESSPPWPHADNGGVDMTRNADCEHGEDKTADTETLLAEIRIKVPKRKIIIEPVIILYGFAIMAYTGTLYQMWYQRFAEDDDFVYNPKTGSTHCNVSNKSDQNYLKQENIQSASARWSLYYALIWAIPGFFTTVLYGAYSDKYGRKLGLLTPVISNVFGGFISIIIWTYHLHINYFFIGAVIEGLSGGYGTLIMSCFSYISDITTKENRSFRITVLEGVFGGTVGVVAFGTGYWIGASGFLPLFLFGTITSTINCLYIFFFVPETVMFPKQTATQRTAVMKEALDTFTKDPLNKGSRWKLRNLLLVFFFFNLASLGGSGIYGLRVLDAPLCFSSLISGIYTGVTGLRLLVAIVLLKLLQIWFSDYQVVIIGIMSEMGASLLFAFATNIYMVFGATAIGIFSGLTTALLRSMMSKIVEPHQIGSLFAALGCIETLCSLMGQSLFKLLYADTIKIFSGITFLVMATSSGTALCLIITYGIRLRLKKRHEEFSPGPETIN